MNDIIERLRVNMHAYGIAQEAADEIERLRAEVATYKAAAEAAEANLESALFITQDVRAERDRLRARIDAVREIYAGMEGFIAQTAPEGYLQRIVKQMYEAALGVEGK